MRKLLLFGVLLVSLSGISQNVFELPEREEIGSYKIGGIIMVEVSKVNQEYVFTYRDANFNTPVYEFFIMSPEDYNTVYETINTSIEYQKEMVFNNSKYDVFVKPFKKGFALYVSDGHSGLISNTSYIPSKKIDLIFGR